MSIYLTAPQDKGQKKSQTNTVNITLRITFFFISLQGESLKNLVMTKDKKKKKKNVILEMRLILLDGGGGGGGSGGGDDSSCTCGKSIFIFTRLYLVLWCHA